MSPTIGEIWASVHPACGVFACPSALAIHPRGWSSFVAHRVNIKSDTSRPEALGCLIRYP